MGLPSFEASNAIIYLTYGAFLYELYVINYPFQSQHHIIITFCLMKTNSTELQANRSLCCLVLATPIKIGIFGSKSDTKGSDSIHLSVIGIALRLRICPGPSLFVGFFTLSEPSINTPYSNSAGIKLHCFG